jgi:hypothetical protein
MHSVETEKRQVTVNFLQVVLCSEGGRDRAALRSIHSQLLEKAVDDEEMQHLIATHASLDPAWEPSSEAAQRSSYEAVLSGAQKLFTSKQPGFATINATRWHNSVFKAYQWIRKNALAVIRWCTITEKTQNSSMEEMEDMIVTPDDYELMMLQLTAYIEVYQPVADLLERVRQNEGEGAGCYPEV